MENFQEESCTKCQKPLLPEARFCGSCGTTVPAEIKVSTKVENQVTRCTKCNKVLLPAERFCSACETVVSANGSGASSASSGIVIIIMLALVIGVIWCINEAQLSIRKQFVHATTAQVTTNTPNTTSLPQSGNVPVDANSGKISAPATTSKPSDSAAIRAFTPKVIGNADKINECQRSLTALMNKPLFGDANWTISMAVQISILDSLADEGLAISTDSQACKPALQLWHQAMNEYKFVTKHLPIAVDSGSKKEYSVTGQHLDQATQYGGQALDMVQELAKSVGR